MHWPAHTWSGANAISILRSRFKGAGDARDKSEKNRQRNLADMGRDELWTLAKGEEGERS